MSTITRPATRTTPRRAAYFFTVGVVMATAIVLFGTLPRPFAGLALTGGAVVVALIDRIASRSSEPPLPTPLDRATTAYLIVLGVSLLVAIGLVWGVVWPTGATWIAWVAAAALFLLTAGGAFLRSGNPPRTSTTSP